MRISDWSSDVCSSDLQIFGLSNQDAATAFAVGLLTIGGMLGWEKLRPASMKLLPGALVGVVLATLAAFFLSLPVARVVVPESIVSAISLLGDAQVHQLLNPTIIPQTIDIAFSAPAEPLLPAQTIV